MKDLKELDIDMPTMIRTVYDRGRVLSVRGEMWMLRTVPMQPVLDARTERERNEAFQPLYEAYAEISALTTVLKDTREIARKNYRRTQLLMVNVPQVYRTPKNNGLKEYLDRSFAEQTVSKRIVILAVKLVDKIGGGGTFKEQFASVADSLAQNSIPLSDYDWDYNRLNSAMARCGLGIPTAEEVRLVDSWWNRGEFPDVHYLPHSDHLHMFRSEGAAVAADHAGRDECDEWPAIPGHSIVSIATVDGFDVGESFMDASSDRALWAAQLLLEDVAAISISALVEPPKVTRNQLRRKRNTFKNDQEEHSKSGKMDRIESQTAEQRLTSFEDFYATQGGSPTLIETSVLVAFNGQVEDMETINVDIANLRPMASRQRQGFAEMMLCSPVRANPANLDIPIQNVACSGIQTLNTVGDSKGALLGFSEHDRQPGFIDPTRQSHEDSSPLSLNVGGTGSGKRLALTTLIPTPEGYSCMGDLKVGDTVYGRSGAMAKVTGVSDIEENPDLYRVAFSDGQSAKADYEHQWVVTGPAPQAGEAAIRALIEAASLATGTANLQTVFEIAQEATNGTYRNPEAVRAALAMVDIEVGDQIRIANALAGLALRLSQRMNGNRTLRPDEQMLSTGEIMAEGAEQFRIRAAGPIERNGSVRAILYGIGRSAGSGSAWAQEQLQQMLQTANPTQRLQLVQGIADITAQSSHGSTAFILEQLYIAEVVAELLRSLGIVATIPVKNEGGWMVRCDAIATLFTDPVKQLECSQILPQEQWIDIVEIAPIPSEPARCITVDSPDGTYLVEGFIPTHNTQVLLWKATQYTMLGNDSVIIDPKALALDTVVRTPLGDRTIETIRAGEQVFGSNGAPCNVVSKSQVFTDTKVFEFLLEDGQSIVADEHHQWVTRQDGQDTFATLTTSDMLETSSTGWELPVPAAVQYPAAAPVSDEEAMVAGVLAFHGAGIPAEVKHGSIATRRLALDAMYQVCGTLMGGEVVLFPQPTSATQDMVDLIRSLGIKVFHQSSSLRFRIAGTIGVERTSEGRLRPDDATLKIVSITPVASRPVQCLTVDSPDRTYLVAGFVTTHNTGSDHSPIVRKFGGHVYSLDQLQKADGIFDPIRFSANKEVGAEIATSMITGIYPWARDGKFNYEVETQRAIAYGVSRGATCTGQALLMARDHRIVPPQVVNDVLKLAHSSPMFRAIVGVQPEGQGLRLAKGLTLIMVGDNHLDLPEASEMANPERLPINQKVNLALIRMMVFGSAMALTGRDGTLHLDEAWMFLGAGAKEVERLGRLARSQRVLPELYTQKVSDALKANIQSYISRGTILHLPDEVEARAACDLFKLAPTEERIRRITAKDLKGQGQFQTVNYESLKALRDPYTGEMKRGSVAIYSDMGGRAIPVEVVLPKSFLALSSTNAHDMDVRDGKIVR